MCGGGLRGRQVVLEGQTEPMELIVWLECVEKVEMLEGNFLFDLLHGTCIQSDPLS